MKGRIAKKVARRDGQDPKLAELLGKLTDIHRTVEEVAEDGLALLQVVRRTQVEQEAMRGALTQEVAQLRADLAGEMTTQLMRAHCRELSPVVAVLEDMLTSGDFSDGPTIRGHIESLTMTVNSAMGRMGIERMPVVAGTDLFDSRIHSCVRVCGLEDSPFPAAPTRTIVRVQSPGFLVHGNVVQPAQVWVQRIDSEINQPERESL